MSIYRVFGCEFSFGEIRTLISSFFDKINCTNATDYAKTIISLYRLIDMNKEADDIQSMLESDKFDVKVFVSKIYGYDEFNPDLFDIPYKENIQEKLNCSQ